MTKAIHFTKMHGLGNDYIYVDTKKYPIANPEKAAIYWSAPHTGIGSDGLVLIGESKVADFSMRIFNADGSEAKMCGNASRCIGKYVFEKGLTTKKRITLDTLSGIKDLQLHTVSSGDLHETVNAVTVDMGQPIIGEQICITVDGDMYEGQVVSMGNPHFVIFVDDITAIDLSKIGPVIESDPHFPDRTNVEFVQILGSDEVRMRVWERGSGITQACGTGACATAVTASYKGLTGRKTKVNMDGGCLQIEWNEETGHVLMTGSATSVFEGEISLPK